MVSLEEPPPSTSLPLYPHSMSLPSSPQRSCLWAPPHILSSPAPPRTPSLGLKGPSQPSVSMSSSPALPKNDIHGQGSHDEVLGVRAIALCLPRGGTDLAHLLVAVILGQSRARGDDDQSRRRDYCLQYLHACSLISLPTLKPRFPSFACLEFLRASYALTSPQSSLLKSLMRKLHAGAI